jgi:hypothetical protein
MASCWAGEIEQPGRIAAQRIPASIPMNDRRFIYSIT